MADKNQNKTKSAKFRALLKSGHLEFVCEAHNGLSAKIVEEAGFKSIWASSLTISAAMGLRDNNEASWTQVLEVLEQMSDATKIPILVDADTGYGNFNNVRMLVKKLEHRHIAAMCIEDKIFPKTNSLLDGGRQQLASIEEFCGKIKAAKESQGDPDFSVVARVEALIAGHGLEEALKRAAAYHKAGADAILIHSKSSQPDEVLAFKKKWGNRCPVIIVPTTYYQTPVEVFAQAGFSMIIWANMVLRGAVSAMKEVAESLAEKKSLLNVEDRLVPVKEIFRLQGEDELRKAEKRYLPGAQTQAVILAASRGEELGALTADKPKALLDVAGKNLLYRQTGILRENGIDQITIVRGFGKEHINAVGFNYVDNDEHATTKEVYSLYRGVKDLPRQETLIAFGDILYKKYIPALLLETMRKGDGNFAVAVDADWRGSYGKKRYTDFVACDKHYGKEVFGQKVRLAKAGSNLKKNEISGEWIGLMAVSGTGLKVLQKALTELSKNKKAFAKMRIADLFNYLIGSGILVSYIKGHWLDVDDLKDFSQASYF